MKPKIIHIIGVSPNSEVISNTIGTSGLVFPKYYLETESFPYWVGFFEQDFYAIVANKVSEKTDKYTNECWRPYLNCDKEYSKKIGRVTHRIFPSKIVNSKEYSRPLIERLKWVIKREKVIVHLHGFPSGHNSLILREVNFRKTPLVVQHRGGSFKFEQYLYGEKSIRNKLLAYFFRFYTKNVEKNYLRNIDFFFMNTKFEAQTIRDMGFKNILLHKDGVDFSRFKTIDKNQLRKKLNLPLDKKIIIYVGRFYKPKGVDKIIEVFKRIKTKMEVHLILIGGSKEDDLYESSVNSGATVITRVSNEELLDYIKASDINAVFSDNFVLRFGGFGRTFLESFACGIPVVSPNLIHFIGDKKEIEQLGEIPKNSNVEELAGCVVKALEDLTSYSKCRQIAKKYYDFDVTISQNIKVYSRLLDIYK